MSSPCTPTPLAAHHLFNLKLILHDANEHYRSIAVVCRQGLRLSHHARKRAQAKGLKVDTAKATRCPQRLVSVLPLHVLDTSISPLTIVHRAAPEDLLLAKIGSTSVAAPRPKIPRIILPTSTPTHGRRRPLPVIPDDLKSDLETTHVRAPTSLRGQDNPWRGPTSRFSLTPNDELFQIHSVRRTPEAVIPPRASELKYDISSESSEPSSTPFTPDEHSSLIIRLKRKPLDVDDVKSTSTTTTPAEKRIKYVRKDWSHVETGATRNMPQRPSSHRRRAPNYPDIIHLLA
ncbi:hypothetical protein D9757_007310 [Collybiopsis confluens]|uniref:Uncharacterized protein n=1 Tax=Collybiopsis confluens TaxID=2823264 RepID=A0A8H5M694_9AGAR|nr:hypothetical protein D9757_007310 [Collybiopsis confluens]